MKTEILCILDRSGSMESIRDDTIGGFNRFIDEQKRIEGEARVTLIQFDDHYEVNYQAVPLAEVKPLTRDTFKPRGWTALYDAVGRTFEDQGRRMYAHTPSWLGGGKWADKVIVVIMTDGGENKSKTYTQARVSEMTRQAEASGWSFVYLGANQDSFASASLMGINLAAFGNAVGNYAANAEGTRSAFASVSASVGSTRTGGTAKVDGLR